MVQAAANATILLCRMLGLKALLEIDKRPRVFRLEIPTLEHGVIDCAETAFTLYPLYIIYYNVGLVAFLLLWKAIRLYRFSEIG